MYYTVAVKWLFALLIGIGKFILKKVLISVDRSAFY